MTSNLLIPFEFGPVWRSDGLHCVLVYLERALAVLFESRQNQSIRSNGYNY